MRTGEETRLQGVYDGIRTVKACDFLPESIDSGTDVIPYKAREYGSEIAKRRPAFGAGCKIAPGSTSYAFLNLRKYLGTAPEAASKACFFKRALKSNSSERTVLFTFKKRNIICGRNRYDQGAVGICRIASGITHAVDRKTALF